MIEAGNKAGDGAALIGDGGKRTGGGIEDGDGGLGDIEAENPISSGGEESHECASLSLLRIVHGRDRKARGPINSPSD